MEGIKQWAFSLCAALVACGLSQMLLPRGNLEKAFRTTLSVFFLCCLLSPLVLQNPQLRFDLQEFSQQEIDQRAARLQESTQMQAEELAGRGIKKIVEEKLQEMGINHQGIAINMNKNGQSAEDAFSVTVWVDREEKENSSAIRAGLKEELGLDVEIVYAKGG